MTLQLASISTKTAKKTQKMKKYTYFERSEV